MVHASKLSHEVEKGRRREYDRPAGVQREDAESKLRGGRYDNSKEDTSVANDCRRVG